jgi:cysteine dioxygenase
MARWRSLVELIRALRSIEDFHRESEVVSRLLLSLLPTWSEVAPLARFVPATYIPNLLYRDERIAVLLMSWARGASSAVHDHCGQDCWLAPLAGALELDEWQLVDGGSQPGPAVLSPLGTRRLRVGSVDHRGDDQVIHRLRVDDGIGAALSLQLYAPPVESCLVFDVEHGLCTRHYTESGAC